MRNIVRKETLAVLFSAALFLSAIPAYSGDPILDLAEGFAETGYYYYAITEYKRFIFFHRDDPVVSDVYYSVAMAHREQGEWKKSVEALQKSAFYTADDSVKDERRVDIGVAKIAAGEYDSAEFILLRVISFSKFPSVQKRARFLLGVCYIYTYNWKEAHHTFKQYYGDSKDMNAMEIPDIMESEQCPKLKNPTYARWLSTFIPGSGQIYSGAWRDGLNSMVINGGFGYLTGNLIYSHNYGNAFLMGFGIFQRYYRGNRLNASLQAKNYNERVNRAYASRIIDIFAGDHREY